jgi:ABC-type phosphate transport system substrate-binding protein
MRLGLVAIAMMCLAGPAAAQQGRFVVVVNQANPVSSLTRVEVSNLFLRKATRWADGGAVHPVDLPTSSPVRAAFSRDIHGRTVASISAYWQQQIFSGRDVPPSERASEAEVVAYVRNDPGAIGYVAAGPPQPGLKVIEVRP